MAVLLMVFLLLQGSADKSASAQQVAHASSVQSQKQQSSADKSAAAQSPVDVMYHSAESSRRAGDTDRALATYREILAMQEASNDRAGQMNTLERIGDTYHYVRSDWRESRGYYERALKIARDLGDKAHQAFNLNQLGLVAASAGEADRAMGFFDQALDLARNARDKENEGTALNGMGNALLAKNDPDRALESYKKALELRRSAKQLRPIGNTLFNLGRAQRARQQYDLALEYLRQALAIRLQDLDKAGEVLMRIEIAEVLFQQRNFPAAIAEYRRIEAIADHRHLVRTKMTALAGLGSASFASGQFGQSLGYYESLRYLAVEHKDRVLHRQAMEYLGIARMALNEYGPAGSDLQEALALARADNDSVSAAHIAINLALTYCELNNYEQAVKSYLEIAGSAQAAAQPNFKLLQQRIERVRVTIGDEEFRKLEEKAKSVVKKSAER